MTTRATTETPQIYTNLVANNMYNLSDEISSDTVFTTTTPAFMDAFRPIVASPDANEDPTEDPYDYEDEEHMPAKEIKPTMRLVRVMVVDPDENLPIADRILVDRHETMTDEDDNELFMGLNIAPDLANHNENRKTVIDKKASAARDKDIYLEPIRIRDLKMCVIVIAAF